MPDGLVERIVGWLSDALNDGMQISRDDAASLLDLADRHGAGARVDQAILRLAPEAHRLSLVCSQCLVHIDRTLAIRAPGRPVPAGADEAQARARETALEAAFQSVRQANVRDARAHPEIYGLEQSAFELSDGAVVQGRYTNYHHVVRALSAHAREYRAGKSQEFAAVALEYLAERDVRPLELVQIATARGAYWTVVAGRAAFDAQQGDREPPSPVPVPMPSPAQWSEGSLLVDAFAQIVAQPEQAAVHWAACGMTAGGNVAPVCLFRLEGYLCDALPLDLPSSSHNRSNDGTLQGSGNAGGPGHALQRTRSRLRLDSAEERD